MPSTADGLDRSRRRLDWALVALIALLGASTAIVWLAPGFPGLTEARALDIAINVSATLVAVAVAILAWVRWRETAEPVALYESSAFVALSVVNAVLVGIVVAGRERELGLAPDQPGEAPIYLWTIARLATAVLLAVGAARSLRRERPMLPPPVLALAPTVLLVAAGVILFAAEPSLAPIPGLAARDVSAPGSATPTLFGVLSLVVQVGIFGTFIAAAVLFRRLYLRDRVVSHAFLAAGLVVAAFGHVHFAIAPAFATGLVTTADGLRLGFSAILFLGIHAGIESDLGALRAANHELRGLREVESSNAAHAERTRLAREIHDGLAQDLWYAKLKQGRLARDESLSEDARTTAREVLAAIDGALAEARQAVMAMRAGPSRGTTLEEVLDSYVGEFADRFGVRAEFRAGGPRRALAPRREAEVLRIVQEALTNVRRHADATLVRVAVDRPDGRVRVTVADNGKGFDPAAVRDDCFGLRGMRERAEVVGGQLVIDSRAADGTRVVLDMPAEGPAR